MSPVVVFARWRIWAARRRMWRHGGAADRAEARLNHWQKVLVKAEGHW